MHAPKGTIDAHPGKRYSERDTSCFVLLYGVKDGVTTLPLHDESTRAKRHRETVHSGTLYKSRK